MITAEDIVALVDIYLTKHEAAVEAGHKRQLALREVWPVSDKYATLDAFLKAHNERAAAFRELRDTMKLYKNNRGK